MGRSNIGTEAFGLRMPVIKQGDDLAEIIISQFNDVHDGDIIGITESIVARAQGNYVTIDEAVEDLHKLYKTHDVIYVYNPIFSRNRFSPILRAVARAFNKVVILSDDIDEVGNVVLHPITTVNYKALYKAICEAEDAEFDWETDENLLALCSVNVLDCRLHPQFDRRKYKSTFPDCIIYSLKDVCADKCPYYGLLGSNLASDELLKLFPNRNTAQALVDDIQKRILEIHGKNVEVMVYGDGCFKDAATAIWEFADPVVSPAYTVGLEGSPNELKFKYITDNEYVFTSCDDKEQLEAMMIDRIKKKKEDNVKFNRQGTTPRRYVDLLGSLMDLISGSGDKGTPVVIVRNYFKNYGDN